MVSALRERAARHAQDTVDVAARHEGVALDIDDGVEATAMRRGGRRSSGRRALDAWRATSRPRWLSFRRFGLGVSIAAAMAASAIGGGLLAARPSAALGDSAVAGPPPHGAAPPASAAASTHVAVSPPAAAAASAIPSPHEPASALAEAALPVAAVSVPSAAPVIAPTAEPMPGQTATSVAASESPPAVAVTAAAPLADLTFGLDVNGDGIPDALERFVRKTISAPATRVAARRYYRVALPLSAVAQQGDPLTVDEQKSVFRAAECYWLSAAEDGLSDPPNLNDRASLASAAAARRMQALAEALQGYDYRVGGGRRQSCN